MKTSSDSIASASASSSTKPRPRTVLLTQCPWLNKQDASALLTANAGDLKKTILQAQAKKPQSNDVIELKDSDDDDNFKVSAATTTIAKKKSSPSSGSSSSGSSDNSIFDKGEY